MHAAQDDTAEHCLCSPPDPMACCQPGASAEAAAAAEEAAARFPDDPTLDDCCARDLKEQRQVAMVKAQLLSMDRTTERTKLQQQVLRTTAPEEGSSDGWDEDDDEDDLGKALPAQRSLSNEALSASMPQQGVPPFHEAARH